ncbi:MAG: hypothetical protein AB1330_01235 [Bacillota bacterium]
MPSFNANPALKAIVEKAVKPLLNSYRRDLKGRIIAYYPESNTADIEVEFVGGVVPRYNVPLPRVSGLIGRDPEPGDEVWVSFCDGDFSRPYVLAVFDSAYTKTRDELFLRQRSKIPDFWGL